MINIIRNLHAMANNQQQNNEHDSSDLKERFNEIIENYENHDNQTSVINCTNKYLLVMLYNCRVKVQEDKIIISTVYGTKEQVIISNDNIHSHDDSIINLLQWILLALEWFMAMESKEIKQLLSMDRLSTRYYLLLLHTIIASEIRFDKMPIHHVMNILYFMQHFAKVTDQKQYKKYKNLIDDIFKISIEAIDALYALISSEYTLSSTLEQLYKKALEAAQELTDTLHQSSQKKQNIIDKLKQMIFHQEDQKKQQITDKLRQITYFLRIDLSVDEIEELLKSVQDKFNKNQNTKKIDDESLEAVEQVVNQMEEWTRAVNRTKFLKLLMDDNQGQIKDESLKEIAKKIKTKAEQCIKKQAEFIERLKHKEE